MAGPGLDGRDDGRIEGRADVRDDAIADTAVKQGGQHRPSQHPRYRYHLQPTTITGISGAAAGVVSALITCPLDVIKTRLQNQSLVGPPAAGQHGRYRGLIGTARTIIHREGVWALYRGLGPMTLGYVPTWAVYMSVYDLSRDRLSTHTDNRLAARVSASIIAGTCATVATNPIWVIKTRFMSQPKGGGGLAGMPYYRSTLDAARTIYLTEGIAAFYSGLLPALVGLSHVAIQFPMYEFVKTRLTGFEMGDFQDGQLGAVVVATVVSKIAASAATYPHEVVRTRLQTATSAKDRSAVRLVRTIVRTEGWSAFYAGMGTNLVRAVPAALSMMVTFEALKGTMIRSFSTDWRP